MMYRKYHFDFVLFPEGSTSGMETRVCVVGKSNFENEELMKALEVNKDDRTIV